MKTKRILCIVTSADRIGPKNLPTGYYFPEVAHAHLVFAADGHEVEFASIKGGEPPMEGYDGTDLANVIFRESAAFGRLNNSHRLGDLDISEFDGVYFPGGHGPMVDLFREEVVKEAIRTSDANGRVIGAVCHGPAALLGVTMSNGGTFLSGRRIAAFTRE